jgi:hypothetical protein
LIGPCTIRFWFFLPRHSNAMVSGDIRVTKAIAK